MQKTTTQELLEASLQLNLRLASSIGILYSREERHQMHNDVIKFFCKIAESSSITNERQIQMTNAMTEGPYVPITDGLLDEQEAQLDQKTPLSA